MSHSCGRGPSTRNSASILPLVATKLPSALRVTGFMSEDVYSNILGEYELELKRQMQA